MGKYNVHLCIIGRAFRNRDSKYCTGAKVTWN